MKDRSAVIVFRRRARVRGASQHQRVFPIHNSWLVIVSTVLLVNTAAGGRPDPRYNNLGYRLMCPCGCRDGLLQCHHDSHSLGPCEIALRVRGELKTAIQRRLADDDILQWFAQKYGTAVLLDPTRITVKNGTDRVTWIVSLTAVAIISCIVIVVVRRSRSRIQSTSELPAPTLDEVRRRIRAESQRDEWGRPLV
jgi:cytochrome c-type biogenesis protein CcmH/NrfF